MENNQIKLMLVEDHDSVREAFCSTLKDLFDFNVICDASNGKEAITLLNTFKPHVILMDVEMPEMNGFEALKIIKEQYSSIKVIMFTAYRGYLLSSQSLLKGADAVISKNLSLEELVITIQTVFLKDSTVAKANEKLLFEDQLPSLGTKTVIRKEILTSQEVIVLGLLCKNMSNKDISLILNLSIRTIEYHRRSIYRKLDAESILDLYKYALKHAIILL